NRESRPRSGIVEADNGTRRSQSATDGDRISVSGLLAGTINGMWQAEVRVDLDAIEHNVRLLRAATRATAPAGTDGAAVMAVVKGDGYGHGMVPAARAALRGGATWLGGCTVGEALALRAAGLTAPVLAWLYSPGVALEPA